MDAATIDALFGTDLDAPAPAVPALRRRGGDAGRSPSASARRRRRRGSRWLAPFVATGQMAFTWYVAHIVLGLGGVVALGLASSRPLPGRRGGGRGLLRGRPGRLVGLEAAVPARAAGVGLAEVRRVRRFCPQSREHSSVSGGASNPSWPSPTRGRRQDAGHFASFGPLPLWGKVGERSGVWIDPGMTRPSTLLGRRRRLLLPPRLDRLDRGGLGVPVDAGGADGPAGGRTGRRRPGRSGRGRRGGRGG